MLKKRVLPSFFILAGFAVAVATVWILLPRLGDIVYYAASALDSDAADTVRGIGTQLSATAVSVHCIIPAVIAAVFMLLRFACPPKGGGTLALYIIAGILLWIAALAAALLFSRLGGIRILDIVRSAADLIGGGILEKL